MRPVLLVTMPWDVLESPSIALGTVQRLLNDGGIPTRTFSAKLAWMDFLLRHQRLRANKIEIADYQQVAKAGNGLGDWVFAGAPVSSPNRVATYQQQLRSADDGRLKRKLVEMRRLAPAFLRQCATRILASESPIVGFTTTFSQNIASLMVAHQLKRANPHVKIVFGGGNCDGPMGAALHRSFPWIDVVVRGECEAIVVDVFRDLLNGAPLRPHPGLCYRDGASQVVVQQDPARTVPMDAVPMPDYDDYFVELGQYEVGAEIRPKVFLSFETSRGCWWGEVAHCTFCGLNGSTMAFRSRSPQGAIDVITGLARRYQVLDLHAIDNIIDHRYFDRVLPALRRTNVDFELFYEIKSNLKKSQVRMLRDARVRRIQPGIESLSTLILRLMRKGVTAFQNVCLLKWCQEYGVRVDWNLLYGFPGEPPEEYERMARLLPSLWHLSPPHATELAVHRFSPYHTRAKELGLELTGPRWYYRYLYDVDPGALDDIAYEFAFKRADGRVALDYAGDCVEAVRLWRAAHLRGASLRYRRGPGFLLIEDRRRAGVCSNIRLDELEAAVLLACDDGASVKAIRDGAQAALAGPTLDEGTVRKCLGDLLEAALVFAEGDRYVSLAVPIEPVESVESWDVSAADSGSELMVPASTRVAVRAIDAGTCQESVAPLTFRTDVASRGDRDPPR
jgi:ribosomal peptide maturation radical SAM protein 1